ncbi:DUF6160 family protein [Thalassolituus marinus]|uniref:DUF6160 domain-containing protein n=1 Tax=Thalassolituus marinus TaxID=671053 RepID=A0ABS7ZKX1_9GAMM|nr:DUF6160 family protein [Thalassolituus marinus]MCA6062359.1 hypothetical protein [Thalassolituus marinus]
MKFLKKASLAAAIAAAPFAAQAELVALDDATMSSTTGQAGVTIDMTIGSTGISVDSITYTDTQTIDTGTSLPVADIDTTGDGNADALSGGSVVIKDLAVRGIDQAAYDADGTVTATELSITQTIDVTEDGDLVLGMSTPTDVYMNVSVGGVELQSNVAGTTNANSELVNKVDAVIQLGAESRTIINNVNYATETVGDYGVTGSFASQKSGLVIQSNAAVRVVNMDAEMFGYSDAQAVMIANAPGNGNGDAVVDAGAETAIYDAARNGAAVKIKGLSFDDGAGGTVNVNQTIWAQSDGVYIQMGNIAGDLNIKAIEIGGASIGSVAVSGINLAGMTQHIYGH